MRISATASGIIVVGMLVGVIFLSGCATTPVFRNGQVLLPVIVAVDAAPDERLAAEELGRVLGQISGLTWPVRPAIVSREHGFYVGHPSVGKVAINVLIPAQDILAPTTGEIGPDGFRLQSRDGSVFIEGATPAATGYAVAWLLQHEAGVRWYVPGESGEIIPHRGAWSLRKLNEVRQPAYVSREITGLNSAAEKLWADRNGLRGRVEFSHALDRIFSLSEMAKHSDWAPQIGGRRDQLGLLKDYTWQPNLALPEVAEHAAQAAAFACKLDPARKVFSLGINDTVRFDQSTATRALVEPLGYFRGMPDYSPLVFTFMNRAAESLARTNPNLYLGCLAYFWCENAPPFPVNRQVLPFVTTDRSQYYDPVYRAADLALMARWGASGVKAFGLWEYAYGQGFLVPRMPLDALAESVREGWRRGARGYFAEMQPQWGFDAFKAWMLAQLLWEPKLTVTQLADDFFPGYYVMAATPMRNFFERCEVQWLAQSGPPQWLKFYQQEDQALLFPPEVVRALRGLLDQATRAAAADPLIATRVARTSWAFAVTEAYVHFDAIRRSLAGKNPALIPEQETIIAGEISDFVAAESALRENISAATGGETPAMKGVELDAFVRNDPVPRLLALIGQHDPAASRRVLALAGPGASMRGTWREFADLLETGGWRTAPNLAANSSFAVAAANLQEPQFLYPHFGALPAKWELRAMPTESGKVALVDRGAGSKPRALRVEGAWDTQLFQWIRIEPDCFYVASARLRGFSSPGNDAALFLTFLDASGEVVGTSRMQSLPKGLTQSWRTTVLTDHVPEAASWVGIGISATRQSPGDWLEGADVELRGIIQVPKS